MEDKQLDMTIHFWEVTRRDYGPLTEVSTAVQIDITIKYLEELKKRREESGGNNGKN